MTGAAAGDLSPEWDSYFAIGDSFSEGMVDPDPERPEYFLGWTDRLAAMLAQRRATLGLGEFRYANIAIRGRLLADVLERQFPLAVAQRPALLSMVGGGNDLLRPGADVDVMADRLESRVHEARELGIDVLLVTPTDTKGAPLLGAMRGKFAVYAVLVEGIARRYGCYLADVFTLTDLRDKRMWGDDRIHLTPEGHHRVALAAAAALGLPDATDPLPTLPEYQHPSWRASVRNDAAWARTHLRPWIGRRLTGRSSGDSVEPKRPELTVLDPGRRLPPPAY